MASIRTREESIQDSLDEAKKARDEMANLKAENEALLREARQEREAMLKEARAMSAKIQSEAKEEAQAEGKRMIEKAREEIRAEKMKALIEVKNQVALLSVEIAEKVLRQEMKDATAQASYVDKLVSELHLN